MTAPLSERIRETLEAARADSDATLAHAESRARALTEMAEATDRGWAEARLERVRSLHGDLEVRGRQIETAYTATVEAFAVAALTLAEAARTADFSPPPMPPGLGRSLEVKLSQTREVTLRLSPGDGRAA